MGKTQIVKFPFLHKPISKGEKIKKLPFLSLKKKRYKLYQSRIKLKRENDEEAKAKRRRFLASLKELSNRRFLHHLSYKRFEKTKGV